MTAADAVREIAETGRPLAEVLSDQVRKVHEARAGLRVMEATLAERLAAFDQEHAELIAACGKQKVLVEVEETTLRAITLKQYAVSQDKDTGPGVGVRIEREVVMDRAQAFAWAKTTGQGLDLNEKAVKQIALATANEDGSCGIPGAAVKAVPKATIARDLGAALEKAEQRSEAKA